MTTATLVLNAFTVSYPSITNRIRAAVSAESDSSAIIQQIIDSTTGHPSRTWSFPGLPRNNYQLSFDEIDSSGNVINNIAEFDIVPGEVDGLTVRDDEQIQGGVTVGFNAGVNTWTFDGTSGAPNYIGWNIVPSELTGRGILVEGLDYSWVPTTGVFTLLQAGDKLPQNQWYNIHFDDLVNPTGASYPTVTDFQIFVLTSNTVLDSTYAGNKVICEPSGVFNQHTLPDINTVPDGRRIMFEVSSSEECCVRLIPVTGQAINFLRGNIYMQNNESLAIYRLTRPSDGVKEWRVDSEYGQYKICGDCVSSDNYTTNVFGKLYADGSKVSTMQYARIYNEVVINLPIGQVSTASEWLNVKAIQGFCTFYSLDDGTGNLYIPDKRSLFECNWNSGAVTAIGSFQKDGVGTMLATIKSRPTIAKSGTSNRIISLGNINDVNLGNIDVPTVQIIGDSPSGFTQPRNYSVAKYILI